MKLFSERNKLRLSLTVVLLYLRKVFLFANSKPHLYNFANYNIFTFTLCTVIQEANFYTAIILLQETKDSEMKNENNYISQAIYKDLTERYQKATLTKKELAHELSMSVSSINNYIVKGAGIPEYTKVGEAKNGTVLFNVICVAEYLSNTIKVA